jgi:hypothetical protein
MLEWCTNFDIWQKKVIGKTLSASHSTCSWVLSQTFSLGKHTRTFIYAHTVYIHVKPKRCKHTYPFSYYDAMAGAVLCTQAVVFMQRARGWSCASFAQIRYSSLSVLCLGHLLHNLYEGWSSFPRSEASTIYANLQKIFYEGRRQRQFETEHSKIVV